jgi:hypothetical protein
MKKPTPKTLVLRHETLRLLARVELATIAAGGSVHTQDAVCPAQDGIGGNTAATQATGGPG